MAFSPKFYMNSHHCDTEAVKVVQSEDRPSPWLVMTATTCESQVCGLEFIYFSCESYCLYLVWMFYQGYLITLTS